MFIAQSRASDPDPLDPQDFGFLDQYPQKYPRIRIQGENSYKKTAKKTFLLSKPKSELMNQDIINILNGLPSDSIKISEKKKKK